MDFEEQMAEQRERTLMFAGFKPEDLSDDQMDVILEPEEAPENYACDCEITESEARDRWRDRLEESGLSTVQVLKAVNYNFPS